MKPFSFPKSRRLVSNSQFQAVLSRGRRRSDGLLVLYMAQNDCGYPRLGVSIGKSHGNAVERNRLKRLLREAFRQNQKEIPAGFDYVLMISNQRPGKWHGHPGRDRFHGLEARATFEQVRAAFLSLVKKLAPKV